MARIAVLCLLALALGGCGGSQTSSPSFAGEDERVASAVEDLQTAGERGDEERICGELLTPALARRMAAPGSSCAVEVGKALGDADQYDIEVRDVTVSGATATARVVNDGRAATLELARVGRDWRIASLGR
jgi:hypothetical protein